MIAYFVMKFAKRRRITLLRKTLRKVKIDEKIDFRIFIMFDKILTLLMRSKNSAKLNREKLYKIINSKKNSKKKFTKFRKIFAKILYL